MGTKLKLFVFALVMYQCNGHLSRLTGLLAGAHQHLHKTVDNAANVVLGGFSHGLGLNIGGSVDFGHQGFGFENQPYGPPPTDNTETVVVIVEEESEDTNQGSMQNSHKPPNSNWQQRNNFNIPRPGNDQAQQNGQVVYNNQHSGQESGQGGYNTKPNEQGYNHPQNGQGGYNNQENEQEGYNKQPNEQGGYNNQQIGQGGYPNQQNGGNNRQPGYGGYMSQQSGQGGYTNQQSGQEEYNNGKGIPSGNNDRQNYGNPNNNGYQTPDQGGHQNQDKPATEAIKHAEKQPQHESSTVGNYGQYNDRKPDSNINEVKDKTTKKPADDAPLFVALNPNEYNYGGDKITVNEPKREASKKTEEEQADEFPIDIRFQDQ